MLICIACGNDCFLTMIEPSEMQEEKRMLSENIKILRKQKGLSQETLAQQLNVVRQTVSKWEKGLSVPDAELLNRLSEVLDTPVSTLLGSTVEEVEPNSDTRIDEISKQLAILNEQLADQAVRKRKTVKRIIIGIVIAIAAAILTIFLCFAALFLFRYRQEANTEYYTTSIECELNGQTYYYEVMYDQNYMIHTEGGDGFISDHIETVKYENANELLAHIEDYFTDRGGSYTIIKEHIKTVK